MRILHTSDWHLGIQLHGTPLLEQQRAVLFELVEHAKTQRVDAVLLAGDLFDQAVASPGAISLYNELMEAFCLTAGIPVLAIAGNHDGASRLAACGALLRKAGLYIAGSLTDNLSPILIGDAAFYLLPHFHTEQARYYYDTPEAPIRSLSDGLQAILDRVRPTLDPSRCNILSAHLFVAGAQTSESDRAAVVGGVARVPADAFAGFDYVALGHLHAAQSPGPGVHYSGCPYPYSFTEAGQEKVALLFDTAAHTVTRLPLHPSRQVRVVRGTLDHLLDAPPDAGQDDYLQIELSDQPPGAHVLALLRERYPHLLLLTGQTFGLEGGAQTLSVEALAGLSADDLLDRFCREVGGFEPDEEQRAWFCTALEAEQEVAQ